jgi:hypothetical protein
MGFLDWLDWKMSERIFGDACDDSNERENNKVITRSSEKEKKLIYRACRNPTGNCADGVIAYGCIG